MPNLKKMCKNLTVLVAVAVLVLVMRRLNKNFPVCYYPSLQRWLSLEAFMIKNLRFAQ